jgi:hypothetical protein
LIDLHKHSHTRTTQQWPIAPDGLGGGDSWLDNDHVLYGKETELATRGYALHRIEYDLPRSATQAAAWQAALATPTRPLDPADRFDATNATRYAPIVQELDVESDGSSKPVSGKAVTVRARLEPFPSRVDVVSAHMYWYKVVERGQYHHVKETSSRMQNAAKETMRRDSNGAWLATLKGFLPSSVVRYRFDFTLDGGAVVKSPRATDPERWHAFFVPPTPEKAASPIYRMFIRGDDWGTLINNLAGGRISGSPPCNLNSRWNEHVPIVFVDGNDVIFARTRFQGSRFNRARGQSLANVFSEWTARAVGPTGISPVDFNVCWCWCCFDSFCV